MKSKYELFDRSRLEIKPLAERVHDLQLSNWLGLEDETPEFHDASLTAVAQRLRAAQRKGAACILMMGGRPVDGFMGAQPEGKLREFLDKHLPSEGELAAEAEADEAHQLLEAGDTQAALQKLADALAADPANDDARFDYVRLLIATGRCPISSFT